MTRCSRILSSGKFPGAIAIREKMVPAAECGKSILKSHSRTLEVDQTRRTDQIPLLFEEVNAGG